MPKKVISVITSYNQENQFDREMSEEFQKVANRLCREADRFKRPKDESPSIGLELEYQLVDKDLRLIDEPIKSSVLQQLGKAASIELGSHQLELVSEPYQLAGNGLGVLYGELRTNEDKLLKFLKEHDAGFVRIGSFPLASGENVSPSQGYEKYLASPRWHREHQRKSLRTTLGGRESINCRDPYQVGLFSSVQVTIDAASYSDAIDLLNRSYMVSPLLVALSAHARYLEVKDSGWADVRLRAWSISHDSRTDEQVRSGQVRRVGLPRNYFEDISDFFDSILERPFVLYNEEARNHAFEVGHGLCWQDARLKWFQDKGKLGVEFRPMSVQPTLEEDIAVIAFYLGRLAWSRHTKEPLIPMTYVRRNKFQAESRGLDAQLYCWEESTLKKMPVRDVLRVEVDRVIEGLQILGVDQSLIQQSLLSLERRLSLQQDPSFQLHEALGGDLLEVKDFDKRCEMICVAMRKRGLIYT